MNTYTLIDARHPAIVARALSAALTSGNPAPTVTMGPITAHLNPYGQWQVRREGAKSARDQPAERKEPTP